MKKTLLFLSLFVLANLIFASFIQAADSGSVFSQKLEPVIAKYNAAIASAENTYRVNTWNLFNNTKADWSSGVPQNIANPTTLRDQLYVATTQRPVDEAKIAEVYNKMFEESAKLKAVLSVAKKTAVDTMNDETTVVCNESYDAVKKMVEDVYQSKLNNLDINSEIRTTDAQRTLINNIDSAGTNVSSIDSAINTYYRKVGDIANRLISEKKEAKKLFDKSIANANEMNKNCQVYTGWANARGGR